LRVGLIETIPEITPEQDAQTQPTISTGRAPLCPESERYTYHALESSATLPGKWGAGYKKRVILRVDHHEREVGFVPATIREMVGVEIVYSWAPTKPGKTARCQYARDKAECEAVLARLRSGGE
jgi:hypothetical protein